MSVHTSADPATAFSDLRAAEYPDLAPGHLNTATHGLAPARTLTALRRALDAWAAGRPDTDGYETAVAAARASFARITGSPLSQVALASTVAGSVGLIAAALPAGAEVVAYEGDFSSLVHPFAARPDLRLRLVPLQDVADAVRPGTALVAVSAAQSADGRVADLPAIRAAAEAHGARVLVDATQAIGWLPLDATAYDYVVCHGYKWLVSPHGACFLTVRPGAESTLSPAFTGWYGADDPWASCYGPVADLAPGARRFDARPAYLAYVGAAASLAVIEELGVDAIHAHDVALGDRLREGFAALGYEPVPGASAIVAVPGVPASVEARLREAGVAFSSRAGNLRFAPHFQSTVADVELALAAAAG
ncbi:aminotransferase class V-fold PLP-dependent enzyme [Streptomyces cocklensis]|jgi:selenocysteine lyase/cysteine desulfurase|uniref:Cysteine desulfurase n=1 Tax=Actinacidiphila cocklensis TaxID=887465 RepID=A0A9W4DK50_9ACTN|nr:aminotransferase class V-fold PLP-dependent enzyme [Actinacidiphila cocklensis]MDD1060955.1 aminotransferase class V-fold PLP-dependent enzyme [Actinacidiphila cocklensis]CAG6391549.1 Cysteine desulfurase [Actinacidiphila cocklensis]